MSTYIKKLNLQDLTLLPVETIQLIETLGTKVSVLTPHKGRVVIDTTELDRGTFKPTTEHEKDIHKVIEEVQKLEVDGMKYLLEKWKQEIK